MLYIIIVIISIFICYKDITERRIPNVAQYFLLLTGFAYYFVFGVQGSGWHNLSVPAIVLIVGFVLSRLNIIGFGDVKLMFTTLLLVDSVNYYFTMMFIVFSGGVWSIAWYFILSRLSCIKKIDRIGDGIPYGVPIVMGLCMYTYVN